MKLDNPVREKSYAFALRIVNLQRHLNANENEFILSKQLLCSGTSIGANIEEAIGGQSEKDFKAKMGIAYKEARETLYWLRLLRDAEIITPLQAKSLISDCEELLKLTGSIIKTLKQKNS
ncbi:MAG: four helix bundle protein [Verrucomicrobiota bacterium]